MASKARHPLVLFGVYMGIFLVGMTWSVLAIPPLIVGGLLTAVPIVPVGIGLYRGITTKYLNSGSGNR